MSTTNPRIRPPHQVLGVTDLTPQTFVVRFERLGLEFKPGQYISVGLQGQREQREYSIHSPAGADYLEILVKEVEGGRVSRALHKVQPGDKLDVQGPFGYFLLEKTEVPGQRFLFIATGTGISPFFSFAESTPGLDYRLIHGIRDAQEAYGRSMFPADRYLTCVSRTGQGDFQGRVTDWLKANPVASGTLCYLCGNCEMIYEVFDLLKAQGIPAGQIFTEVYF